MAEEKHGGFSDTHPSDGHRLTEAFNSTVEISHKGLLSHVKDDGCCKIGWATKLSSVCRYLLVPMNLPTYFLENKQGPKCNRWL